ncbi:serine/threonine-protein kinase Nek1-like [Brienomyrus brachyistius]|uniref:serine/threonine-protein kinase Nek1-like n=1 Tax=Brienomyrus brachyistius TaxID=42636 RepID=UPI0020B40F32|nr:serine/threonine-protein kinase Nek1-like [Brienomyrus brachyistius]
MGSKQSLLTDRGYTFLKDLGTKNTGTAALVNKNEREYIIKTISMTNMDDKTMQRTQREVASLADMDHPHIVRYVESFTDENSNYYIAMDYCEGGDLSEKIKAQKIKGAPFSEDQILDWFVQICLALKYVHHRNIVHRNIKPQNIFLTKEETIKLGDFGVSKILRRKDEYAKNKLEKPIYISPELWKGDIFNEKSDIWALGCVLYELCTLEFAFSHQEQFFMFELWSKPSPQISENFSAELRNLVDELLHKDPAHRPTIDSMLKKEFLAKRIPLLLKDRRLEEGCMDNQEMPVDRNMRQTSPDKEAFKNLYDRDVGDILSVVEKLEMTAEGLERIHFGTTVGSLTAGGVTSAVSNVTNMVNQSMDRKTIEEIISEYRDKMEPILMHVEGIVSTSENEKKHESCTDVVGDIRTGPLSSLRKLKPQETVVKVSSVSCTEVPATAGGPGVASTAPRAIGPAKATAPCFFNQEKAAVLCLPNPENATTALQVPSAAAACPEEDDPPEDLEWDPLRMDLSSATWSTGLLI